MDKSNHIYFDNAATSKVDSKNLLLFNDINDQYFANPNSPHEEALKASLRYQECEEKILDALHLENYKVIFTSGATEANNLAIRGVVSHYKNRGGHVITSTIEHPSVLETFKALEKEGVEVTYLEPDENGVISPNKVISAIRKDTILVSLMHVNNEVGAINDIDAIGEILLLHPKIIFHVDAVQAIGKINCDYKNVDLITISSHKIHGLKGSGALIKKSNIQLDAILYGGGQQEGERSGTLDLANACVLSEAFSYAIGHTKENREIVSPLRERLVSYLLSKPKWYHLNSSLSEYNPYIVNFSLLTAKASVVVEALSREGIYVSTKSSCHSASNEPSYVLLAMTHDKKLASECIRVSFSKYNTLDELETFISVLDKIVGEVYNG
ncbi:MAG: cysteine desulfurase [Coprobacillus sp.]|nr:cysteine desulfurase [Coprobacillus sp.]